MSKLIRKIAALSSEGQRKSYCRELLCCSGRTRCCNGSRLWEAGGRAPGLSVLGALSPLRPAAPRSRWIRNFLGRGATTRGGFVLSSCCAGQCRALPLAEMEVASLPSFLKLPTSVGFNFDPVFLSAPQGHRSWREWQQH